MSDPLPPALERLGAEIERVARAADAEAAAGAAGRRRRVPRMPRALLVALVATATLATAAAVAATTGLLTGAPVPKPKGIGFTDPHEGWGVPIAKTIELAPLRVGDPDGGPPWGLRTLRTTRGLGCVQVGRVQDGQLGVVGQDGAFADDGKFHVMGPDVLTGALCSAVDGAGHTFLAIVHDGVPAGGLERGCAVRALGARPGEVPPCPRGHLRNLVYGLLGPAAASITYRAADGTVATQRVTGPEGAYLVVGRPSRRHPGTGAMMIGPTPAIRLLSVRYRDGSVCRTANPVRLNGARRCPAKGYVAPKLPRLSTADVATRVTASVARKAEVPRFPGVTVSKDAPRQRRVTVRFRAPVAAIGQARTYGVSLVPRDHHRCGLGALGVTIERDVAAGDPVRQDLWLPTDCHGTVDLTVTLRRQTTAPQPPPLPPDGRGQPVVGRVAARIP
ncbi:MAG TPA: hypothetical protein VFG42_17450 [Baekduia sp.]|uniref:hypothetical protein n=1 Tax=Baekduia sp. TaxID=2600305 RepID=UPI002D7823C4|nr:hypothetical protein [Baekduia sp.]HET6508582.1 hypothetical protein [Baekduia sp.]